MPGRKEAFYPQKEVDRYARSLQSYINQFTSDKLHFGLALIEDIPDIRQLVADSSGGMSHTVPQEVMEAWIRRNPQALHVLRKGTDIVGYISMFPLPYPTIIERLAGRLMNRTIPIDDIQAYTPHEHIKLYIAEAVIKEPELASSNLWARDSLEKHETFLSILRMRISL